EIKPIFQGTNPGTSRVGHRVFGHVDKRCHNNQLSGLTQFLKLTDVDKSRKPGISSRGTPAEPESGNTRSAQSRTQGNPPAPEDSRIAGSERAPPSECRGSLSRTARFRRGNRAGHGLSRTDPVRNGGPGDAPAF